jgi:threonine dehydratase
MEVLTRVDLETINAARARIRHQVIHTPVFTSQTFSAIAGCPVLLKAENLQRTGSFKIRGAINCLSQFTPEQRERGVVTASAGNHAQGVAMAARLSGIKATVYMPLRASIAKVQATRGSGADVRLVGEAFDEAVAAAKAFAEETGAEFVSAFDHDDIIAGQGSVGLELLEDVPDVETVIVPVGGGGLMSGVAIALKETRPDIRIIGVQAEGANAFVQSYHEHRIIKTPAVNTIADGIAIKRPAERTLHYIQKYVDEMVSVPDEATANAIVMLMERAKLVVEGAGAVGVAALQTGIIKPTGRTAVILSGGNIDTKLLSTVIERGMTNAHRYMRFFTCVDDRPGGLAKLMNAIADMQGNLIEVIHNRSSSLVPLGMTGVEVQIETRDMTHIDDILDGLSQRGYQVQIMP